MTVKITNSYTASNPSLSTEIIGSPFTVTVVAGNSIPGTSTVETYQTTHIAGTPYTMTMQSRDSYGNTKDSTSDIYSV